MSRKAISSIMRIYYLYISRKFELCYFNSKVKKLLYFCLGREEGKERERERERERE